MYLIDVAVASVLAFATLAVAQQGSFTTTITRGGVTVTIVQPISSTATSDKPTTPKPTTPKPTTAKPTTTKDPGGPVTVTVTETKTTTEKPITAKPTTPTTKPPNTTPHTTQPPDPNLTKCPVPLYYKCGGEGFTGCKKCVQGAVCTSQNQFYYQCVSPDS